MRPVVLMSFAGLLAVVATANAQQTPAPPAAVPSVTVPRQTPPPGQQPATAPPTIPAPGQQQGQRGQQGSGQQGQGQPQPPGRGAPPPGVPAVPYVLPPRAEPPSTWQNVKIDVAISDSVTAEVQTRKTINLLILDGRSGQIRSTGSNSVINVDAAPTIRQDGRIYLHLTLEYQPELTIEQNQILSKQGGAGRLPVFIESLSLILVDGKMMVASQSADPRSERKVTVEITATVQK
jgi:hypothetical protein